MDSSAVHVVKEMGVSHREFFRILPNALAGAPFERDGLHVVQQQGGRRLEIIVSPEGERRLSAVVALPVTRVELIFNGFSDAERVDFLERYQRAYQKTAG